MGNFKSKSMKNLRHFCCILGQSLEGTTPSGLTLAQVMEQCSFLVNGARSDAEAPLQDADRVDVLPPFAGG